MSEGEQKLVDTAGDYLYAVRNGERVTDPAWRSCRLMLTDERLVLATNDGKQGIPHSRIRVPEAEEELVPPAVDAAGGTALEIGDNVVVLTTKEFDNFEPEYCRAALHNEVILTKHPAVVGGVVQEDAGWSKARFRLEDTRVTLDLPGGDSAAFDIENVGTVEVDQGTVMDEQRTVVKAEHTDDDGNSVETHFSGVDWHSRALESLLRNIIESRQDDYELDDTESQVLMALYSGVSPFEISDFVGISVDEVERIYNDLLEAGVVDKVRERTEVTLNAKGRNMASEAMNEQ
jgi:hypothetical protein